MASSVLRGQTALCTLQPVPHSESVEESMSTYSLPVQLKIAESNGRKKGTASGFLGNGMDVYKVSKAGKRQLRRVAISADNRKLLISSNSSIVGRFKKKNAIETVNGNDNFRKIEISSLDQIIRGQITDKFVNKKLKEHAVTQMMPVAEDKLSLSIIFRISTSTTDRLVQEEDLEVGTDSANQMATLDLVIPSHNNYEVFVSTVRNLMTLNKKYANSMHRDILLLQYHWMEIGKQYNARISQSEWTTICCDRLSTDIGRNAAVSVYRKYCKAVKINPVAGIPLQKAVGLLEHTRKLSLLLNSVSDPCDEVWNLLSTNGKGKKALGKSHFLPNNAESHVLDFDDDATVGSSCTILAEKAKMCDSKEDVAEEYVSAEAFLSFAQKEQHDTETTLEDIRMTFESLNAQVYASQLDNDGLHRSSIDSSYSKDYITKAVFISYLRSDANDVFDPMRGDREHDDMDQPLSSYWINASHDTFLKGAAPKMKQQINGSNSVVDVSMYTAALNRGCRCLEIDVWDGVSNQQGQPVVRFDEPNTMGSGNAAKEGIFFSCVIKAVHSFLVAERNSPPVILIVEAHCDVSAQEKMSQIMHSILGADDMLFVPSENDLRDEDLPSPNELRGKVVLKSKIPAQGQSKALCDDFDNFNDVDPYAPDLESSFDKEGDSSVGAIVFETQRNLDKDHSEVVKTAKIEADRAKKAASAAEDKAFNFNVNVNRAQEFSNKLLSKAGITAEFAKAKVAKRAKDAHVDFAALDEDTEVPDGASAAATSCADSTHLSSQHVDSINSSVEGGNETATEKRSLFQKLLTWAGNINGDSVVGGTYLDDEDREAALSMNSSGETSTDDSRDDGEYEFDFDFDINVKDFSPTNLMSEFKAALNERKEANELSRDFQLQKRSISNVNRKLQLQNDGIMDDGVEVQHFYSSTVDFALAEHKDSEEGVEKASKVLGVATAILNKRQQEYERMKPVERYFSIHDEIQEALENIRQAETTSATARSEHQISEERAVETAENAEVARDKCEQAHAKEEALAERQSEEEKNVALLKENLEQCNNNHELTKKRRAIVKQEHEKVTEGIKKIEGSHRYKVEKKEASRGALGDGTVLRKHRAEIEKQLTLNMKLQEGEKKVSESDQKRTEVEFAIGEAEKELQKAVHDVTQAKVYSNECEIYVDEVEQLAGEEKDAAKMREQAYEKSESMLVDYNKKNKELEREFDAMKNKMSTNLDVNDRNLILKKSRKAKVNLDEAEINFQNAQETYKWADARLKDANDTLNENSDALYKAKLDAKQFEHRMNADEILKNSAITAYERLQTLIKEGKVATTKAAELHSTAAHKATSLRLAQDYKQRQIMFKDISPKLVDLTFISSSKFRYFEESIVKPVNVMLNISEGRMMQLLTNDGSDNAHQFNEFNKSHLTRIFPSRQKKLRKQSSNFNPVLPWSLGCQIVAMNQQVCDAFVLVNDGRFRANASCGYVLKPASMIQAKGHLRNKQIVSPPSKWQFKILSGYNLPKPRKKALAGFINPRVRITLYDGGTTDQVVYLSQTVKKNGLNPVWGESYGITFVDIQNPESAIVMFSIWDFTAEGAEDFIAAAAVPISCMRQGYRSVPLFDVNHMRCGAHAFTSLFIHAKAM